ncbi:FBXO9 [Mytilus edulis]|uniref:F-box only protein 9 n=1 Tax=Mytilus edulis TaxID=6550 RepID=A0A8S3RZI0_MYTED|nr:FBXO9 [Mytilus edulis]
MIKILMLIPTVEEDKQELMKNTKNTNANQTPTVEEEGVNTNDTNDSNTNANQTPTVEEETPTVEEEVSRVNEKHNDTNDSNTNANQTPTVEEETPTAEEARVNEKHKLANTNESDTYSRGRDTNSRRRGKQELMKNTTILNDSNTNANQTPTVEEEEARVNEKHNDSPMIAILMLIRHPHNTNANQTPTVEEEEAGVNENTMIPMIDVNTYSRGRGKQELMKNTNDTNDSNTNANQTPTVEEETPTVEEEDTNSRRRKGKGRVNKNTMKVPMIVILNANQTPTVEERDTYSKGRGKQKLMKSNDTNDGNANANQTPTKLEEKSRGRGKQELMKKHKLIPMIHTNANQTPTVEEERGRGTGVNEKHNDTKYSNTNANQTPSRGRVEEEVSKELMKKHNDTNDSNTNANQTPTVEEETPTVRGRGKQELMKNTMIPMIAILMLIRHNYSREDSRGRGKQELMKNTMIPMIAILMLNSRGRDTYSRGRGKQELMKNTMILNDKCNTNANQTPTVEEETPTVEEEVKTRVNEKHNTNDSNTNANQTPTVEEETPTVEERGKQELMKNTMIPMIAILMLIDTNSRGNRGRGKQELMKKHNDTNDSNTNANQTPTVEEETPTVRGRDTYSRGRGKQELMKKHNDTNDSNTNNQTPTVEERGKQGVNEKVILDTNDSNTNANQTPTVEEETPTVEEEVSRVNEKHNDTNDSNTNANQTPTVEEEVNRNTYSRGRGKQELMKKHNDTNDSNTNANRTPTVEEEVARVNEKHNDTNDSNTIRGRGKQELMKKHNDTNDSNTNANQTPLSRGRDTYSRGRGKQRVNEKHNDTNDSNTNANQTPTVEEETPTVRGRGKQELNEKHNDTNDSNTNANQTPTVEEEVSKDTYSRGSVAGVNETHDTNDSNTNANQTPTVEEETPTVRGRGKQELMKNTMIPMIAILMLIRHLQHQQWEEVSRVNEKHNDTNDSNTNANQTPTVEEEMTYSRGRDTYSRGRGKQELMKNTTMLPMIAILMLIRHHNSRRRDTNSRRRGKQELMKKNNDTNDSNTNANQTPTIRDTNSRGRGKQELMKNTTIPMIAILMLIRHHRGRGKLNENTMIPMSNTNANRTPTVEEETPTVEEEVSRVNEKHNDTNDSNTNANQTPTVEEETPTVEEERLSRIVNENQQQELMKNMTNDSNTNANQTPTVEEEVSKNTYSREEVSRVNEKHNDTNDSNTNANQTPTVEEETPTVEEKVNQELMKNTMIPMIAILMLIRHLHRGRGKQELMKKHNDTNDSNTNANQTPTVEEETPTVEEEAKFLFYKGMKLEQSGHLYEAIKYYREATHLDSEIEFKCYSSGKSPRERQERRDSDDDLVTHFQKLQIDHRKICQQQFEQNATHISVLPVELLIYIFKWVVSPDLDIKQLEILSEVSRGFHICARDDGIWRQICSRTWGPNTGKLRKYVSWRNMFINRPHVLFNGCYISRTSYMRVGEKSLDSFYKPWHLVEYFRYMRFFPDGVMLMISSSEDPYTTLSKLRSQSTREQGLLIGRYRFNGDRITSVLKRVKTKDSTLNYYPRKRQPRQQIDPNEMEQTFQVEMEIQNHKDRCHAKLVWLHYSVTTCYKATGQLNETDFELNNKNYPPLLFSRVLSYTAESESPLE